MNNRNSDDQVFSNGHAGAYKRHDDSVDALDSSQDSFDDDEFEEPDRDTDYTSVYTEEIIEDDEFEGLLGDPDEQYQPGEEQTLTARETGASTANTVSQGGWPKTGRNLEIDGDNPENETPDWGISDPRDEFLDDDQDGDDDWVEDDDFDDSDTRQTWPLGLIGVAVIALLLLGAGGYGVIQQRSAMETEIRELQGALATAASPEDVAASRNEVKRMREQNAELRISVDSLTLENRRLKDTVSGLESQLAVQQETLAKQVASAAKPAAATPKPAAAKPAAPKPAATKPAAAAKPVAVQPAATAQSGWFVNFGSYSKRATAESWTTRLSPASGKVVVTTGNKGESVFYRVRVVNLGSRDEAERIARQLEKDYGLSKLWVGSQ